VRTRRAVRVAAVTVVVLAIAIGLGVALLEAAPSRPAEGRAHARGGSDARPVEARRVPRPKTIVMLVFDEFPLSSLMDADGRIDAERYPAFAELARTANWYRGATAVHDSTAHAVPAMLDGRYPRSGTKSNVYSHPGNLFTLLADRYELHISEEATGLCPTSMCKAPATTTASNLSHGKVMRFRRFVRGVRTTEGPALWFKHTLLPHVPWMYYPSSTRYRINSPEPIPDLNGTSGFSVPWVMKVAYQRHLIQVGLADRLLGELVARLERTGLFDDALVVVAADHGISFHTGRLRRALSQRNVADIAPVPLLVKLPGQRRGRVFDRHVETIDVLPTILDAARVHVALPMDGRSMLRPAPRRARQVRIFHRVGHELNTVGGYYAFDADDVARRLRAAVRRKIAMFGSGGGRSPDRLFAIGPHTELLGQRPSALPRLPGPHTARLHQVRRLRDVRPASGVVPGELTGWVPHGRRGGGRAIAVAVNGTIVAMGRTFSMRGRRAENFEVMVPERTFLPGENVVRVWEVGTSAGRLALRPL
jgi:hypothetical protein